MLRLNRTQRGILIDKELMTTAIVMLSGIALFVGIITAMDLWTQRQDRRNGSPPKSRP